MSGFFLRRLAGAGIFSLFVSAAVAAEPQRVISLGPVLTEELFLLGLQDRLVGCTTYCVRPEEAAAKPRVATVVDVSIEKIVSLRPDLVLATAMTDKRALQKLRHTGIAVKTFDYPRSFAQICSDFIDLAEIFGARETARTIVEEANARVQAIRSRIPAGPGPTVFLQVGVKPLFTAPTDSFLHELVNLAGGRNIAAGSRGGFFSREEVIRADPDCIIITTMGVEAAEEKKQWQLLPALRAVRAGRIYVVDSYEFCSPTPQRFPETLQSLVELLYPQEEKR